MLNILLIANKITANINEDISLFSEISFQNFNVIEFVFNSLLGFCVVLFVIGLLEKFDSWFNCPITDSVIL